MSEEEQGKRGIAKMKRGVGEGSVAILGWYVLPRYDPYNQV